MAATLHMVGDVMTGRSFNNRLTSNPHFDLWGNTPSFLDKGPNSAVIGNLETNITSRTQPWPDKTFNFRMDPSLADVLTEPPFHHLNLANNHSMDFGGPGLVDTMEALDRLGISHAGAGVNLRQATQPAIMEVGDLTLHIFGAVDHTPEWAAGVPYGNLKGLEGVFSFDLSDPSNLIETIQHYRDSHVDSPRDVIVTCLHWGPNWEPQVSREKKSLAQRLIREAGVRIIHGTSAHHLQPYEFIGDGVVFYALGDFIDDYAVDPYFRNDLGEIASVRFDENGRLIGVDTVPTRIDNMRVDVVTR